MHAYYLLPTTYYMYTYQATKMFRMHAYYSLPTTYYMYTYQATEMFRMHASFRTRFTSDELTSKWRWTVDDGRQVPVYDMTSTRLLFTDRSQPVFYESSRGNMWLNHCTWDAFSFMNVLRGALSRHLSANEVRISQLHLGWEGGAQIVREVLGGQRLFDPIDPFVFVSQTVLLPANVIGMVKTYSARVNVTMGVAWSAFIMVLALQCAQRASATFWYQGGNRDAQNADVLGYVTVILPPTTTTTHRHHPQT